MKRISALLGVLLVVSNLLGPFVLAVSSVPASSTSVPSEEAGWVLVSTRDELAYINQNQGSYINRNIRLTNDIDMTGYSWIPFGGNGSEPFSGIFDGRGHRITGLTIDGGTLTYVGLFGRLSGTVKDLGAIVHVEGGSYTGGLAGHLLDKGNIIRSYTHGSVTGGANSASGSTSAAGGLTGASNGDSIINRSYSSAAVKSGATSNQFAGGLTGSQGTGSIIESYAIGAITNSSPGMYVTSGGLAGQLIYGTIQNSYAAGAVTVAPPSTYHTLGGFVGAYQSNASIINSYFDHTASQQLNGVGDHSGSGRLELTGRATPDMKNESNYGADWDFSNTWSIHPYVNDGYPYFRPTILTSELPRAATETPYSFQLEAFDGAGSGLSWMPTSGILPLGIQLTNSGELVGTPMVSGTFPITVTITDAGGNTASTALTLYVDELAPDIVDFDAGPGNGAGSTKVTATPISPGHAFAYVLGEADGMRPILGAALPSEATLYPLGSDIGSASPGQLLQVYEIDSNHTIQAWSSIQLEVSHIQDQIRVTGVTLNVTELVLTTGQPPVKLTALIEPANATNQAVSWSSSNPNTAQVSQSGEVMPIAEGASVITVTTEDGLHTAHADVTVRPPSPITGTVTGSVYGTGNTPLPGASVSVGGVLSRTDAEGRFTLTDTPEGTHTLKVAAAAYMDHVTTVNVVAGAIADVGRIDLIMEPAPVTSVVTGTVYGIENNPISGAYVSVGGITSSTDSVGEFTLMGIPEGRHTLTAAASGYTAYTMAINVAEGKTVDVGRIHLSAVSRPVPSYSSYSPPGSGPSSEPVKNAKMSITINGLKVQVTALRELEQDGRAVLRLVLDADLIERSFASGREVVIDVNNEEPVVKVDLPAAALQAVSKMQPDAILRIGVNGASYSLPLRIWGVAREDTTTVTVAIGKWTEAARDELAAALTRQGFTMLAEPVYFSLYADREEWAELGGAYVERTLSLQAETDRDRSTVVWVDEKGRLYFIPSVFGKGEATFYSPHNSVYTAISSDRTFADVMGHWAQRDVELLANKLILQGVDQDRFEPDRTFTRAEFVAMVVRALGLVEKEGNTVYSDIRSQQDWYAGAVGTATEAGLIKGYDDGTFRPNAPVMREQMVVILARAIRYAGELPPADASVLDGFSDQDEIAAWARTSAAELSSLGLIEGVDEATFAPKELATRAQSAVLLRRMLQYLKFID